MYLTSSRCEQNEFEQQDKRANIQEKKHKNINLNNATETIFYVFFVLYKMLEQLKYLAIEQLATILSYYFLSMMKIFYGFRLKL